MRAFPLGPAADMYITTYKNRILNKPKKTYGCLSQAAADKENIKHCYIAIGLLYLSNQEKKQQSLRKEKAIYGCGSAKNYRKLADLRLRTTYCYFAEFAVAEQNLNLRCSALLNSLSTAALEGREVLY